MFLEGIIVSDGMASLEDERSARVQALIFRANGLWCPTLIVCFCLFGTAGVYVYTTFCLFELNAIFELALVLCVIALAFAFADISHHRYYLKRYRTIQAWYEKTKPTPGAPSERIETSD